MQLTQAGVKFEINFISCSEKGNEIVPEVQPSIILLSSLPHVEFIPKFHSYMCYHKLMV